MEFIKNHLYKDIETKRILVFDNMLKSTSGTSGRYDIYFLQKLKFILLYFILGRRLNV